MIPFTIHYAYIENHEEKRASTVVTAYTLEGAKQEFQKENPHVLVVASPVPSGDPSFLVNLRVILAQRQLSAA